MKKALTQIHLLLEREDFNYVAKTIVDYYKSKVPSGIKIRTTRFPDKSLKGDYNVDDNVIQIRTDYKKVSDFAISVLHEIKHAMDAKSYNGEYGKGPKAYKKDYEMEMNYQIGRGKDEYDDNKYEIEAEKWAQNEYRRFWKNKL